MSHRRRFLNLVLGNKHGVYSLHHIDLHSPKNSLFYDPTPPAASVPKYLPELKEMECIRAGTRPRLRLQPAGSGNDGSFSFLRRRLDCVALSDTKTVFLDYQSSGAVLYDDRDRCLATLPNLMQSKWYPICLSSTTAAAGNKEDDTFVFVFERRMQPPGDAPENRFQFQALVHRKGTNRWHCEELPPPPYISDDGYWSREIKSYGMVNGGVVVCDVSSEKAGTYCFDPASRAWSKAGDWALPFEGEVHHVPELGLLVGVGVPSRDGDHQIRACPVPWTSSSASTAVDDGRRREPTLCDGALQDLKAFDEEFYLHSGWPQLVSLGSGKFCVVRCFVTMKETCSNCNHEEIDKRFAVFTGVEVVRRSGCGKDDGDGNDDGVRVIKHKSKVYMVVNNEYDGFTIR